MRRIAHNTESTPPDSSRYRIAIVASRFNETLVQRLLDHCLLTLVTSGVQEEKITLVHVPGAFEIPVAMRQLLLTETPDAAIALGVVLRGETAHFDLIAHACSLGIGQVALDTGVPVIFGVLTVENQAQAEARGCSAAESIYRTRIEEIKALKAKARYQRTVEYFLQRPDISLPETGDVAEPDRLDAPAFINRGQEYAQAALEMASAMKKLIPPSGETAESGAMIQKPGSAGFSPARPMTPKSHG